MTPHELVERSRWRTGFAVLACAFGVLAGPGLAAASKETAVVESPDQTDCMGAYQRSPSYPRVKARGVRVLNLPAEDRFATVWRPDGFASNRVMVLLHGTHGTAYEGIKDEWDLAEAYDLLLVGIQWFDPRTDRYDAPEAVYRRIDRVLRYLHETDGFPLTSVALSGFSRGSAISYEVTYRDRQAQGYFDLTISHSGGIPPNAVVAPGESSGPGEFYVNLQNDRLGPAPFAGTHFFLYAGGQDEQWGAEMAEKMAYTRDTLTRTGADVAECLIDPQGTHMGYWKNPAYHERAIQAFVTLTGGDPTPVRAVQATPSVEPTAKRPAAPARRPGPPPRRPRPAW